MVSKLFLLFFGIQILHLNLSETQGQVRPLNAREYEIVVAVVGDFQGDKITIDVNGRKVFSDKISTNWSTGIAKHLAQSVESPEVSIKAEIPELSLKAKKSFNLENGRYFEISLIERKLVINQFPARPLRD